MDELKYLDLHGDRIAYRDVGSGRDAAADSWHGGQFGDMAGGHPPLSEKYRVVAPDLLGHGQSAKPRGDYSLGAFAVWLRDLLDELGVLAATIIGQSLGGGVAMQFVYQHPDYCQRLVLISSGGLGPDVGWTLRLLSAPGAELILPAIAPRPILTAGNKLRSWFSAAGIQSPRGGEMWSAYSSLADKETRQAFLRTLRSVVDYRGQAVSALNRLHLTTDLPTMVIWGDHDRIIPGRPRLRRSGRPAGQPAGGARRRRPFPARRAARRGGRPDRRLHRHDGSADDLGDYAPIDNRRKARRRPAD